MVANSNDRLRVLITNNTLAQRAGSELYVRDLAIELMRRGHNPIAYSTVLGEVAEDLRRATIPVIDDLRVLSSPPDIIHGQHHLETMTAALYFSSTPVVYACHGWIPWEELPPVFPSIMRYIAVDDLCIERIRTVGAISEEDIDVIYNFVDLVRFKIQPELPASPKSALVFSNYARGPVVETIKRACHKFGIGKVDVAGAGVGNVLARPEDALADYDVVFAKARCALEAMASGRAVVVADLAGMGGLVTTDNVEKMRRLNFGVRTLQTSDITEETVLRELAGYDPCDARKVSLYIREKSSMSHAVDRWLSTYYEVLDKWNRQGRDSVFSVDQMRYASDYLRKLSPTVKKTFEAEARAHRLESELRKMHKSWFWKLKIKYRKFRAALKGR
jgi:glycosyltransferase involved in cell wall biosynthesis